MEREYACDRCGLIFWGTDGGIIGQLYPTCPDCGATMGTGLHTVDSTGWVYAAPEVVKRLATAGKFLHVRDGLFPEEYRDAYKAQGVPFLGPRKLDVPDVAALYCTRDHPYPEGYPQVPESWPHVWVHEFVADLTHDDDLLVCAGCRLIVTDDPDEEEDEDA